MTTKQMPTKEGLCEDQECSWDWPDEVSTLRLFRGVWRCDCCIEAIQDDDEFRAANAPDFN